MAGYTLFGQTSYGWWTIKRCERLGVNKSLVCPVLHPGYSLTAASLVCWVIYLGVLCVHEGYLHELVFEMFKSFA